MSATTTLSVSASFADGAYVARVAGYSSSAPNPYQAVRAVAEKAAREMCGLWEIVALGWHSREERVDTYQVTLRSAEA